MIFSSLDGIENWIQEAPDDFLYVKVYNGIFSERGRGAPFINFVATDKEDAIEKLNMHLDGATGTVTFSLSNRDNGGTPLKRHVKIGSAKSASSNSSASVGGFDSIGGLAGYLNLRDENLILKMENQQLQEQNEALVEQIENPEQESFLKQAFQDFRKNPEQIGNAVGQIIQAVSIGVAALKAPIPAMNGGTQLHEMDSTGSMPENPENYTEEEILEVLNILGHIHTTYFPGKPLLAVVKALESKLQTMPMMAQMLFTNE